MAHKATVLYSYRSTYLPRVWWVVLFVLVMGTGWFHPTKAIFLLDYVPAPIRLWEGSYYFHKAWIWTVTDGILWMFGHVWWSKLYLGGLCVGSLLLGYRRAGWIVKHGFAHASPRLQTWALLVGMTLFVVNPVYSARMGTQPGIWLWIVLLGRWIYRLLTRWQTLRHKDALIIGCFRWVAMMTMQHASFMIVLMLICFVLVQRSWKPVVQAGIIAGIVGLLNANRLLAGLSGTTQFVEKALSYSSANMEEFATIQYGSMGPIVTSLLWYGFRGEKYGSAYIPVVSNARWWIAGSLLVCLWRRGRYRAVRQRLLTRSQGVRIMVVALLSLLLGVGIASDMLAPTVQWLHDHLPGYRGMREPHKRVGVYMMLLLPGIVYGRMWLWLAVQKYRDSRRYTGAMLLLCFARAPWVIGGMQGRYTVTDYPSSYSDVRELLTSPALQGKTRVHLPWHNYMQCAWTKQVIANPLRAYMRPASVIIGDNIEIGDLYTNSTSARSKDIETFLTTHEVSLLQQHWIDGIVYTPTCADFERYAWLATLTGMHVVSTSSDLILYLIDEENGLYTP